MAVFALAVAFAHLSIAQAETRFVQPFGLQFNLNNLSRFTPNVIRVIRQDNQGNTKDIDGFANLVKQGNRLLARDNFGRLFNTVIDGAGDLLLNGIPARFLGALGNEVLKQTKEFLLQNVDKLRGRALSDAGRLLFRNGSAAALLGNMTVDLRDVGAGPSYANCKNRARALSFLINEIADIKQRTLFQNDGRLEQLACSRGVVSLNLRNFIRPDLLARLENDNPRACGRQNAPMDLGWLIRRAMDPNIYYALTGTGKTVDEKADTIWNRGRPAKDRGE